MRYKGFTKAVCILLFLTLITPVFIGVQAVTWSVNTKRLTTYPFHDGYPALTQTSDGRIWVVWSREVQANLTLYYKTSSDLGKTWSSEMNLTRLFSPGHNQNPSIMQAQNGTIWVAWMSDRPPPPPPPTPDFYLGASPQNLTILQGKSMNSTIIVTSTNNFSDTVSLTVLSEPPGVATAFNPTQVTPPPNGTANSTLTVSVNATATPGNYTLTVIGKGDHIVHTLDLYLEITIAGGTSPNSTEMYTFSSEPTATAPFAGDYEIYYKTSHDNGATWSRDVQLTDNNVDDLRPAILQLANGTILIFWQTYISGSFNIVYRTTTDGISWSNITQLTTDSAHDKGPAATQTKDGKIWVVWASNRTGDYEIFYSVYDGISWSNDTRLTYSTNLDVGPAILQSVNEDIWIFWASSTTTGTSDIYVKYSSDSGSSWVPRIEFVDGGYEDKWPAVTRTIGTKIWVAWMSDEADQPDGNWEIYCKTSLAGDVNEDNVVDFSDLTIVSTSYGASEGGPGYDLDADITRDGIVDIQDLMIVSRNHGET